MGFLDRFLGVPGGKGLQWIKDGRVPVPRGMGGGRSFKAGLGVAPTGLPAMTFVDPRTGELWRSAAGSDYFERAKGLGAISSFDDGPLVKIDGIPRPTGRAPVSPDTVYKIQIPLGARGTTETLLKMKAMAIEASQDGAFIQMSRRVVADCGPRDYACEGSTIYQHVGDVTTYRSDPAYAEWVMSPGWLYWVEKNGASDCDDQACLTSAMDVSVGRACRYGAYMLDRAMAAVGEYSHVLCEFALPGPGGTVTWAGQDTVAGKGFGWTPPQSESFGPPNYVEVLSP